MGEAPAEAGAAALPGAQETGPAWHTPVTALVDRVDEQDLRAAEGVPALMDSWEPGKTQPILKILSRAAPMKAVLASAGIEDDELANAKDAWDMGRVEGPDMPAGYALSRTTPSGTPSSWTTKIVGMAASRWAFLRTQALVTKGREEALRYNPVLVDVREGLARLLKVLRAPEMDGEDCTKKGYFYTPQLVHTASRLPVSRPFLPRLPPFFRAFQLPSAKTERTCEKRRKMGGKWAELVGEAVGDRSLVRTVLARFPRR